MNDLAKTERSKAEDFGELYDTMKAQERAHQVEIKELTEQLESANFSLLETRAQLARNEVAAAQRFAAQTADSIKTSEQVDAYAQRLLKTTRALNLMKFYMDQALEGPERYARHGTHPQARIESESPEDEERLRRIVGRTTVDQ